VFESEDSVVVIDAGLRIVADLAPVIDIGIGARTDLGFDVGSNRGDEFPPTGEDAPKGAGIAVLGFDGVDELCEVGHNDLLRNKGLETSDAILPAGLEPANTA
jgi:hypothetical protein